MSSNEILVRVIGLGKQYEIYDFPGDRLKQFIFPKMAKLLGKASQKYFREFWALRNVSFELRRGEALGIIGRNGAGKSTLLQIICGTLSPSEGEVKVNGRVAALLELGSGFNPEFTGRENIYLNATILGLSKEEILSRFEAICDFADIGDFIEQPVKTYSSGMLVRLAFAVIANVDADILVIDEALAVGDTFFSQKCMRFIRKFMETGSVIFVSHDTNAVKGICDRALWISQSKIIKIGPVKDVCESYLEDFFESTQQLKSFEGSSNATRKIIKLSGDQRLKFINESNLRNDLEIFEFDITADPIGNGGAEIFNVFLMDEEQKPLRWVVGGEDVVLNIFINISSYIKNPIVGFFIKDKLGQNLFGDNTFLTFLNNVFSLRDGSMLEAKFKFKMPIFPAGEYSICAAIAEGSQESHRHLHWIHDAVIFKSQSSSICTGLLGIPMKSIELREISNE